MPVDSDDTNHKHESGLVFDYRGNSIHKPTPAHLCIWIFSIFLDPPSRQFRGAEAQNKVAASRESVLERANKFY